MAVPSTVNPLFTRLTRNAKWPSLRVTVLLTIGLSLLSTLVVINWISSLDSRPITLELIRQSEESSPSPVMKIVPSLAGFLLIFMPLIIISISALVTYELVTDKEIYQLLGLVFSPQIILNGLISTILYRVRILLAFTVVLMPFMVANPYQETLSNARWGDCYIFTKSPANYSLNMNWRPIDRRDCSQPSDIRFLQLAALKAIELTLLSWGICLFGLILGLWSAMLWRRRAFLSLMCITMVPIVVVVIITFLGPTTGEILTCTSTCLRLIPWPPLVELISLLVPYVMACGYALLARRSLQSDLQVSQMITPSNIPG